MKPQPPVTRTLFGCRCDGMLSGLFFQGAAYREAVLALTALVGEPLQLRCVDEPHAIGDLFDAGYRRALATLECGQEVTGIQQALLGTGIEPGRAATEDFHPCPPRRDVDVVHVSDFQLAPRGRFEILGDV